MMSNYNKTVRNNENIIDECLNKDKFRCKRIEIFSLTMSVENCIILKWLIFKRLNVPIYRHIAIAITDKYNKKYIYTSKRILRK